MDFVQPLNISFVFSRLADTTTTVHIASIFAAMGDVNEHKSSYVNPYRVLEDFPIALLECGIRFNNAPEVLPGGAVGVSWWNLNDHVGTVPILAGSHLRMDIVVAIFLILRSKKV